MARKIIFLNQSKIYHHDMMALLEDHGSNWKYLKDHRKFDPGTVSLYSRFGADNMPFRNSIIDLPGWKSPEYDHDFDLTFGQITDQRCFDLWKNKFDRPWIVYWSGGIDSTTIVSSILKNLPVGVRENISIACNQASVSEYPWFYFEHIKPNFRVIDSSVSINSPTHDFYSINGELADQLFAGSISQSMLLSSDRIMRKNLHSDPDDLLAYIEAKTSREFSIWYYESILENINSVDVPIQNYHDFFWWTFFNHSWVSTKLRVLSLSGWSKLGRADEYLDDFINWFDTADYQKWSMVSNKEQLKYGDTLGAYKQAAKDYIYSINKDIYYHKFKTKTSSGSHQTQMASWICMLDDYSLLSLGELEQILEMLPEHINR